MANARTHPLTGFVNVGRVKGSWDRGRDDDGEASAAGDARGGIVGAARGRVGRHRKLVGDRGFRLVAWFYTPEI